MTIEEAAESLQKCLITMASPINHLNGHLNGLCVVCKKPTSSGGGSHWYPYPDIGPGPIHDLCQAPPIPTSEIRKPKIRKVRWSD